MCCSCKRISAAFVVVAAMTISILNCPRHVFAHAIVIGSDPADGATLPQPPTQVVLRFNAKIVHSLAVYDLASESGKRIVMPARVDKGAIALLPDCLVVPMPRLKRGSYVLRYKVLATDGHATLGILRFSIK